MMRLLLGLLLVGNLLLFLYGYLGMDDRGKQQPRRLHEPDVGSIRLLAASAGQAVVTDAPPEQPLPEGTASVETTEQMIAAPASPEETHALPHEQVVAMETSGLDEQATETESEITALDAVEGEQRASMPAEAEKAGLAEEKLPREAGEQTPVVPEKPSTYCGAIGPLRSRIQAKRIRRKLGSAQSVAMVQKPTLVDKAYWVLIPPLSSRSEAQAVVERLKGEGVEDGYPRNGSEVYENPDEEKQNIKKKKLHASEKLGQPIGEALGRGAASQSFCLEAFNDLPRMAGFAVVVV